MQTFPKLIDTFSSPIGIVMVQVPANESVIRLHKAQISLPNNNTLAVAGFVDIGVSFYKFNSVSSNIYDRIFLPAIAITTIPGSILVTKDFGPLGVLCYPITAGAAAQLIFFISATLGIAATCTIHYNIEPLI